LTVASAIERARRDAHELGDRAATQRALLQLADALAAEVTATRQQAARFASVGVEAGHGHAVGVEAA
jgi:hypothetical protein